MGFVSVLREREQYLKIIQFKSYLIRQLDTRQDSYYAHSFKISTHKQTQHVISPNEMKISSNYFNTFWYRGEEKKEKVVVIYFFYNNRE